MTDREWYNSLSQRNGAIRVYFTFILPNIYENKKSEKCIHKEKYVLIYPRRTHCCHHYPSDSLNHSIYEPLWILRFCP